MQIDYLKGIKKRLLIGIIVILVCMVLYFYFANQSSVEDWIMILLLFGGIFGGIFFILVGLAGAIFILGQFAIVLVLPEESQGLGYLILFGMFLLDMVVYRFYQKYKIKKKLQEENPLLSEQMIEKNLREMELLQENPQITLKIQEREAFSKGRLRLTRFLSKNGDYYEIIPEENGLSFQIIGNAFSRSEVSKKDVKKSFRLQKSEIEKLELNQRPKWLSQASTYPSTFVNIYTNGKKTTFITSGEIAGEEIKQFFQHYGFSVIANSLTAPNQELEQEKIKIEFPLEENTAKIRSVVKVLDILSRISCIWLFFYPNPLHLVILVNCLWPIAAFLLCIIFPNIFSIAQKDKLHTDISTMFYLPIITIDAVAVLFISQFGKVGFLTLAPILFFSFVTVVVGSILLAIAFIILKQMKQDWKGKWKLAISIYAYAFGAVFFWLLL